MTAIGVGVGLGAFFVWAAVLIIIYKYIYRQNDSKKNQTVHLEEEKPHHHTYKPAKTAIITKPPPSRTSLITKKRIIDKEINIARAEPDSVTDVSTNNISQLNIEN